MIPILGKLFDVKLDKLVNSIGENIDRFVTTDAEREALKREIIRDAQAFELEFLKDKQNAREMYKTDSWLQKIYALVFLAAYMLLTGFIIAVVFRIGKDSINLPEWGIAFISTLFGAMSTKVGTITDFLFGSSQGSRDKDENIKILSNNNNTQNP